MEEPDSIARAPESKKSISPLVFVGGFLVLGAATFFVFSKTGTNLKPSPESPPANQAESLSAPAGSVREFRVDGSSYEFNPNTITVKKGDTVKIIFKDNDSRHNLVIDGYNVSTDTIGKGSEDTIQFVADKAGSFEYYCSVSNHRALGMTGTLVVE